MIKAELRTMRSTLKKIKALFSVDYMINIVRLIDTPIIKIGLKNDSPLIVWWSEKDLLEGVYALAPRIQSE